MQGATDTVCESACLSSVCSCAQALTGKAKTASKVARYKGCFFMLQYYIIVREFSFVRNPANCEAKNQGKSDKLHNPTTRKKLIEGDTVWERTRKREKQLNISVRNLFTRIYPSIFSARFSPSWRKEVLIFHVAKVQILVLLSKRNRNIAQQ